jgi:hypothetical protein
MSNHSNDIQELQEVLGIISEKVPKLITEMLRTVYSEEAGAQMGKAVGKFYQELVASGIPAQDALIMAKDYMNTIKSVTSNFSNHNHQS